MNPPTKQLTKWADPSIELVACGSYDAGNMKNIPYIDSAAVISEDETELAVFIVNRSLDSECELNINLFGDSNYHPCQHIALEGSDLKAVNTADEPENVIPVVKNISEKLTLSPHSWNMIILNRD